MSEDKIHILMIDDDEEDFIITKDILLEKSGGRFALEWVSSYEDGLRAFGEKKHDVYLVDYRLGVNNGIDLIREGVAMGVEAPFILMTGQSDPVIDTMALEAGAADFLVKGSISSSQLERAIRYSIEQNKNVMKITKLNAELEERVKERTQTLENALRELKRSEEELAVALEKEKELNDLKSRFVAMASHEFRTPLATILSSLTLVKRYAELGDPEKMEKHTKRIGSSVSNMTELLNDVLSLSKLEEGKIVPAPESFSLMQFAEEIIREMRGIAKPSQEILYSHDGDAEDVSTDKKIVRNILHNLVSNAIKFSDDGKKIEVRTSCANDTAMIEVKDNGIGISEEDQKHLFQRFFRGQNVSNIQGTGLGLSILAKYVEVLHGKINMQSELGKGTVFSISFPVSIS
ncbi:MAG TPA: hybrid sensor histidine kinase/response regulator [Bacteroidia bacterium]|nr:hybrid sensor histidine kinase/response regulator [Bacteroidia bacterium]